MTTTTLGAALDRLLLSEDVDDEQSLVNALVAATGLVDVDPETIDTDDPHSAMRLQTLKQRLSDARESLASVDDVILASSSSTALATKQESVDDVAFARELASLVTDIDDLERMRKCCQLLLDVDDRVIATRTALTNDHTATMPSIRHAFKPLGQLVSLVAEAHAAPDSVVMLLPESMRKRMLDDRVDELRREMNTVVRSRLAQALSLLEWPKPIGKLKGGELALKTVHRTLHRGATSTKRRTGVLNVNSSWEERLLDFRDAFVDAMLYDAEASADGFSNSEALAFRVLCEPILLRFRFHFEGDRPTNRLDKPEWFFAHAQGLIRDHQPFLVHVVQPIVRELPQTCGTRILNVVDVFIAGLLPGVQSKIRSDLLSLYRRFIDAGGDRASMAASAPLDQSGSQSMPTPAKDEAETAAQEKSETLQWAVMVRHLVKETIAFDKSLSELYGYRHETAGARRGSNGSGTAATSATTDGPCLSIVTGDPKRFDAWLSIERFLVTERFRDALTAGDPWKYQYEGIAELEVLRVTTTAVLLMDTVESVTETYKHLRSMAHRLEFFDRVQRPLLDLYLDTIRREMDQASRGHFSFNPAATLMSIAAGDAQQPAQQGAEYVVDRACRWYNSIEYVMLVLREWNESLFFLELQHAKTSMELQSGDDITSASSTTPLDICMFDDIIDGYRVCATAIATLLADTIRMAVGRVLRAYEKKRNWTMPNNVVTAADHQPAAKELTPEFLPVLSQLHQWLRPGLIPADAFEHVLRAVMTELDERLWVMVQVSRFSVGGAKILERDVVVGLGESFLKRVIRASGNSTFAVAFKDSDDALVASFCPRTMDCCRILTLESMPEDPQTLFASLAVLKPAKAREVVERRADFLRSSVASTTSSS